MIKINNLKMNFENKVLDSGKVIIVPHKNADFDAIGSAIGLSLAVRNLDRQSTIVVDDKTYELDRGVQNIIREARREFQIKPRCRYLQEAKKDDLFVLTDVNKNYLISLGEDIKDPEKVIIIDHHEPDNNTVNSNYKYIDSSLSSASELIAKLLFKMKVPIPKNVAKYLLAGIYLDTNKMTRNVSDQTFKMAGKLIKCGTSTDEALELFTEDFDSENRIQDLVNRTKLITYKIALVLGDNEEEYTKKEIAKAADKALSGCYASFAVAKLAEDTVAISARSQNKIDVDQVMKNFPNGGGTKNASAATIEGGSIEEIGKKLVRLLRPNYIIEKSET